MLNVADVVPLCSGNADTLTCWRIAYFAVTIPSGNYVGAAAIMTSHCLGRICHICGSGELSKGRNVPVGLIA